MPISQDTIMSLDAQKLFGTLCSCTTTTIAQNLLNQEPFLDDITIIKKNLHVSDSLKRLKSKDIDWFNVRSDIEDILQMSENSNEIITPSCILSIKDAINMCDRVKNYGRSAWIECEPLFKQCTELINLDVLRQTISNCFDNQGKIRTEASFELLELAYQLTKIRKETELLFSNALNDASIRPYLQDTYVTMRNGRYTLPIKEEMMSKFKGIVQDVSKSEHTIFMEPLSLIKQNNSFRQKSLEYESALEQFKENLKKEIIQNCSKIKANILTLCRLDALIAKAKFLKAIAGKLPKITNKLPSSIQSLSHPLLALSLPNMVSHDFEIENNKFGIIITGPNGGGKTVFLKSIGLNIALIKKGLLPCASEKSSFIIPNSLFAAMIDEENLALGLSSFTGYLMRLKEVLSKAKSGDFVILDEPLKNTDPIEGSCLIQSLLEAFFERKVFVFVATHNPWLKTWAKSHPNCKLFTLEFDQKTHNPTYRLMVGALSTSFSLETAKTIGFPEKIIKKAEKIRENNPLFSLRKNLEEELDSIKHERLRLSSLIGTFEEYWQSILLEPTIKKIKSKKELGTLCKKFKEDSERMIKETRPSFKVHPPSLKLPELKEGDKVKIEGMKGEGVIIGFFSDKQYANVLLGKVKIKLSIKSLKLSKKR